MMDILVGHPHYCFLDGYLGYNQIAIPLEDQEKKTFVSTPFRSDPIGGSEPDSEALAEFIYQTNFI